MTDQQTSIHQLLSRQSISPAFLDDPIPTDQEMQMIFDAALRAPDHCQLHPFHFMILKGEQRKKLGDIFAEAFVKRTDPAMVTEPLIEKERERPTKAPIVIIVSADIQEHPKVPEIEQYLTIGAGIQNMLNVTHMLGYGGMFLTGPHAYDPFVKEKLGIEAPLNLVGFYHLGSVKAEVPVKKRQESQQYIHSFPLS